jgi:hypothetical protein
VPSLGAWAEANQRYLVAKLAVLRGLLAPGSSEETLARRALAQHALEEAAAAMPSPPALELLASAFGLSAFERDLVLMCAGVELDSAFANQCAAAQGDSRSASVTFGLALAVLPDAHWSALGQGAPLRRFHLVEVGKGEGLTRGPLRIDERVLHFLVGIEQLDERLSGLLDSVVPATVLSPSHAKLAGQVVATWGRPASDGRVPIVQLCGGDAHTRRDIAAAACSALGLRLDVLAAGVLAARTDIELLGRLLAREQRLGGRGLLLEVEEADVADAARFNLVERLLRRLPEPVLVSTRGRLRSGLQPGLILEVHRPTATEQLVLWREALASVEDTGGRDSAAVWVEAKPEALTAQFDLDALTIRAACATALAGGGAGVSLGSALWDACRAETRQDLDALAQRLEPAGSWEDLVLPEPSRKALREIALFVRQRSKIHDTWGFAGRDTRGLGVGALFVGPSGTGKTLAAEVLAAELRLDLYRIDLSRVVSKYIGETEKNLSRVFDAAERGAAILLFDEAEALFGRRGEVRDSNDRYANMEVAYLLQRMEAYRGLAILTTNIERAIDPAFLRRLRFVVRFPLPGVVERAALWERVFPPRAPTEGLDFARLAQLGLTGGNIQSIALRAAFLAAEAGTPVRMEHVLEAAQAEYEKLGRTLGKAEPG